MTDLRKTMLEELQRRNLSKRTRKATCPPVEDLALHQHEAGIVLATRVLIHRSFDAQSGSYFCLRVSAHNI